MSTVEFHNGESAKTKVSAKSEVSDIKSYARYNITACAKEVVLFPINIFEEIASYCVL